MATRIYQGKILSAQYLSDEANQSSALDALNDTNKLFHDAVNYHLAALAGMASFVLSGIGREFYHQFEALYLSKDVEAGESLQMSVTRSLGMSSDSSFSQVINEIFGDAANWDMLPFVFQYIVDKVEKGEGVIQQEGRGLLPKLCDKFFKGNFDYSIKEKKALLGKKRLKNELMRAEICDEELRQLALEMDLSWAGIKTQPDEKHENSLCYSEKEVMQQVKIAMDEFCVSLTKKSDMIWKKVSEFVGVKELEKSVAEIVSREPVYMRSLAKNNKAVPAVKHAAIFFMFYPCKLSAEMLKWRLGEVKEESKDCLYDYTQLENDPLIMARGEKGYIYKGFTALPCWETNDDKMCSSEFDILAFKEALKTLHGFVLKTEERKKIVETIDAELHFIEKGEGKSGTEVENEEDNMPVVLGGDPRFDAMKRLVKELSFADDFVHGDLSDAGFDADDNMDALHYIITSRTIQSYDSLRKIWLAAEAEGKTDFKSLSEKVRDLQSSGVRFGSQLLFESLCKDEYRIIWHDWSDNKHPRSKNLLKDFSIWQALHVKKIQYQKPVRISAANPVSSPRQLMYSDMSSKECKFISGKREKIQVVVAVRNERFCWKFVPAILEFSAPRFERDELGRNAAAWNKPKKGEEAVSWLQPMIKAMGLSDSIVKLERTPAAGLYVKYKSDERSSEPLFYLNFPVSLNFEPLQKIVGKADKWKGQFLGGLNEKLHLHWPSTYKIAGKIEPWWKNEKIKESGFDVLGVDLGMRSAFAWSLVHVAQNDNAQDVPGRLIGVADGVNWYGTIRKQGVTRLDGEKGRKENDRKLAAASLPSQEDVELIKKIYGYISWDDKIIEKDSLLDMGRGALNVFRRRLSRARMLHAFLSKLHSGKEVAPYLEDVKKYFSYGGQHSEIVKACAERDVNKVKSLLLEQALSLHAELPSIAVDVTNLLLPRKHGHWKWIDKSVPGWQGAGQMILCDGGDSPQRRVFHRGGISIERITQLEILRQRLQSMSKILSCSVCEKVPLERGVKVLDPCPLLFEKIENMREQRVNMIAHEIVAQALGVRLITSGKKTNSGGRDVWHGEYECIPDRRPVDFVVMENLQGYQTSIDRTSEENSSLMRWSHRQITAKVVQLLHEVFGIPVLFTHAAYTSRFDCMYSSPGFRPELLTHSSLQYMRKSSNEQEVAIAKVYDILFDKLQQSPYKNKIQLVKPHYKNGGSMFLSECCGKLILRNADVNAATNIAWRGIAAPESLHLLHRVRMEMKKSGLSLCWKNEREKALKGKWKLKQKYDIASEGNLVSSFYASPDVHHLTFASYGDDHSRVALVHGKKLWGELKHRHWTLCHRYNVGLLHKAGINTAALKKLLMQCKMEAEIDEIPT